MFSTVRRSSIALLRRRRRSSSVSVIVTSGTAHILFRPAAEPLHELLKADVVALAIGERDLVHVDAEQLGLVHRRLTRLGERRRLVATELRRALVVAVDRPTHGLAVERGGLGLRHPLRGANI